jgi:hypothetical protein
VEAAPGRHFYGHGFFTPDGRLLYATENDFDGERGVVGVYDVAAGFRRIGEIDTHGLGPHEALLLRDGRTIAIANGGILTHPDFPRRKLNLATMRPSLSYLDRRSGDLLERTHLPASLHQLSIRHMDEAADGAVWFGGQYEGPQTDLVALVGRHRRGGDIELVHLDEGTTRRLSHYVGSVRAGAGGERIAVTSPRGGVALVLDAATGRQIEARTISDVCGVAADGAGFAFSSGQGRLIGQALTQAPLNWDNHLRAIAER